MQELIGYACHPIRTYPAPIIERRNASFFVGLEKRSIFAAAFREKYEMNKHIINEVEIRNIFYQPFNFKQLWQ
jgi:hypothetical protein